MSHLCIKAVAQISADLGQLPVRRPIYDPASASAERSRDLYEMFVIYGCFSDESRITTEDARARR